MDWQYGVPGNKLACIWWYLFVRPQIHSISIGWPDSYQAHTSQPQENQWESYQADLKVNLGVTPRVTHSVREAEMATDVTQQAILLYNHQNCPFRVVLWPRTVPWWNKGLSRNTTSTRRQINEAKRMGGWESFKMAAPSYNKEIRKVNWSNWRN